MECSCACRLEQRPFVSLAVFSTELGKEHWPFLEQRFHHFIIPELCRYCAEPTQPIRHPCQGKTNSCTFASLQTTPIPVVTATSTPTNRLYPALSRCALVCIYTYLQSGWYKRSWLGWAANNSLTDLHPTHPEAYKRVAVQPLLHLPPALRTLHLDARKGRDSAGITDSNVPTIGRDRSPLSASTVDSTHGEGGPAAVRRGACRPEGEARGDYYNGTVQSSAGNYCCLQRKGSDSRCETNEIVGAGVEGHRGVRLGGCERTHVAQWTERQRTMCLVPDVGGRTTYR